MPISADEARLRRRRAKNVRRARVRLGLTQEAAAERADIAVRHWQKLEAGAVGVTLGTLTRLSRVLGLAVADLLS